MGLRQILSAAKIPVIVGGMLVVVETVLSSIIGQNLVFSIIFRVLEVIVLLYAGYSAVGEYNLSLLEGGSVGGIVGICAAALQFIIGIPQLMNLMSKSGLLPALIGMAISVPVVFFFFAAAGAVIGLIGGFIAQKTKNQPVIKEGAVK